MADNIKFSDDELKKLKGIQEKYIEIQHRFGQTTIARMGIEQQLESLKKHETELKSKFKEIQNSESGFIDEVTDRYGDGTLNIESGEFIPNKSD